MCPSKQNGFHPSPTSCSQYYICASGNPFKFTCGQGLLWNEEHLFCDWPKNVVCKLGRNNRFPETQKVTERPKIPARPPPMISPDRKVHFVAPQNRKTTLPPPPPPSSLTLSGNIKTLPGNQGSDTLRSQTMSFNRENTQEFNNREQGVTSWPSWESFWTSTTTNPFFWNGMLGNFALLRSPLNDQLYT